MESITLKSIEINKNLIKYNFSTSEGNKKLFNRNFIFVEFDFDVTEIPESILVLPFLANMLPIAWISNSVLWVKEVDRTFYKSQFFIKKGFEEMYPQYRFGGTFVPAKLVDNSYKVRRESLVLFSGGVDANTTFIRTVDTNPMLLNIYGWFDESAEKNDVCDGDKRDINSFATNFCVDSTFVKSNFGTLVNNVIFNKRYKKALGKEFWGGFQHGIVFISIASVVAFYYGIKNIYIASSNTFGFNKPWGSDPRIDSSFEFATIGKVFHDGYELSRQDKIKVIVDYQRTKNEKFPIRVCSFNDKNCRECEKCFRTTVELIAEGVDLSDYDLNVDGDLLEHWKNVFKKTLYCFPVWFEDHYYWYETRKRMKENYDNITEKTFVDWFLNYDFYGEQKKALRKYYIKNFFSILKRKMGI